MLITLKIDIKHKRNMHTPLVVSCDDNKEGYFEQRCSPSRTYTYNKPGPGWRVGVCGVMWGCPSIQFAWWYTHGLYLNISGLTGEV